MRKILRFIYRTILYFFIVIFGMLIMYYLSAPIYNFSGPVPFSGDKLYNPYQSSDSNNWRKYNFQVQSKAWLGITDGRKNTNQLIDSVYNILGYDHVATSDYQKINYYGKEKPSFIPTYEHGYNIFKTHQVCIGAESVLWTDLLLWQTTSMKQWILDLLKKDNRLVVIAHPLLRGGYTINDMTYLTNYDAIEVLNNMRVSTAHWDEALSSGQIAYIIGNDDAHDVLNSNDVGRRFTMINSKTLNQENILQSLEKGNAYGMDFVRIDDEPMDDKIQRSKDIPSLRYAKLYSDTLKVKVDRIATSIKFITSNGEIAKEVLNNNKAEAVIGSQMPYLRTHFSFADGSNLYLNPVIRYSGDGPTTQKTAEVDSRATLLLRIVYFICALLIAYGIAMLRKSRRRK